MLASLVAHKWLVVLASYTASELVFSCSRVLANTFQSRPYLHPH
jgi:hypothetical protein